MIVASGSKYFAELFRKYDQKALPEVTVPKPFNQIYENNSDDQVIRILKYIYGSQDIYKIKNEISCENIFNLYAQAYALRCEKLMGDLTSVIIEDLLSNETVAHFYQDSIEFENTRLQQACEDMIVRRFDETLSLSREFVLTLPSAFLVHLIRSDALNVQHEQLLVDLIKEFFEKRKDAAFRQPVDPQSTMRAEVWNLLTPAEQKARTDAVTKEKKAIADKEAAEMAAKATEYQGLKPLARIQYVLDLQQEAINKQVRQRLERQPLTNPEKMEIFKAVRWAFMTHEQLVAVSRDPAFELAREMIFTALSCRLDTYDATLKEDVAFSLVPRSAYKSTVVADQMVAEKKVESQTSTLSVGNASAGKI